MELNCNTIEKRIHAKFRMLAFSGMGRRMGWVGVGVLQRILLLFNKNFGAKTKKIHLG